MLRNITDFIRAHAADDPFGWAQEHNPNVAMALKAAATAQSTTDSAQALVDSGISGELVELLRDKSVFETALPFMRTAPFEQRIAIEESAASAQWVGEGELKPITAREYDAEALQPYKANIVTVVSRELWRFSRPSIEEANRRSLARSVAQFLDEQFLDPTVAAIAGLNPASVTNGSTPVVSTGPAAAQIQTDLNGMLATLASFGEPRFIMGRGTAAHIAGSSGAIFPKINVNGGELCGIPVSTAEHLAGFIALVDLSDILVAVDPLSIAIFSQGSIILDDGTSPSNTDLVSMWQKNLMAIRVERRVSWLRAHAGSATYMAVAY